MFIQYCSVSLITLYSLMNSLYSTMWSAPSYRKIHNVDYCRHCELWSLGSAPSLTPPLDWHRPPRRLRPFFGSAFRHFQSNLKDFEGKSSEIIKQNAFFIFPFIFILYRKWDFECSHTVLNIKNLFSWNIFL